jgi:microcystin-dependent protein
MSNPFVGEIRMFGGNFAPVGWALCQGQLLAISENPTLFNLIGTTYGGDGQNTFALPNLQSRVPIHVGPGFAQGQIGGAETVTLTTNQLPVHSHVPLFSTSGQQQSPAGAAALAVATSSQTHLQIYSTSAPDTQFAPQAVQATGGGQPHDNMIPFLCVNFIISLFGIFPSQS